MTMADSARRVARRILRAAPQSWQAPLSAAARRLVVNVAPAGSHNARSRVEASLLGLFDEEWYHRRYPDIAASGSDPYMHYMRIGWREGRSPAPGFDDEVCARLCPGFRIGAENPILHMLHHCAVDTGLRERLLRGEPDASPPPVPPRLQDGLCITGYLCSEIGLGQAARNLAYACDTARLPLSFRDLPLPGRQNDAEFATKCNLPADRRANLVVTGLPSVPRQLEEVQPGRVNILYPFWELGRIAQEWEPAIRAFDEVWAPSRFVASAFEGLADLVVHLVPQPVRMPRKMPPARDAPQTLRFFTYLDVDSFVARKNPRAAVEAFRAAFPLGTCDVELVVKTRGSQDDGLRRWLGEAAVQDPRIRVVDRTLNRAAMDALMAECDAFISLHRSEGFGFGAAEALAAGKAVVATDYSSTTDFINEDTGYPVAYRLERVRRGEYVHGEGQLWATADRDAAVAALRAIASDPAEAEARTRRGFALLQAQHAPEVAGRLIARMLRERGLA